MRKDFRYPRDLTKTDTHNTLLEKFREDNMVNLSLDEDSIIEETEEKVSSRDYKTFFMLNSTEYEISTALKN